MKNNFLRDVSWSIWPTGIIISIYTVIALMGLKSYKDLGDFLFIIFVAFLLPNILFYTSSLFLKKLIEQKHNKIVAIIIINITNIAGWFATGLIVYLGLKNIHLIHNMSESYVGIYILLLFILTQIIFFVRSVYLALKYKNENPSGTKNNLLPYTILIISVIVLFLIFNNL